MILKPEPRKDPGCLLTDSDDKETTGQPRFKEEGQALPLDGKVAYVHKGKERIDGGRLDFRYNIQFPRGYKHKIFTCMTFLS